MREAALFKESSRLYRQADEGGKSLLAAAVADTDFFTETLRFLKAGHVSPVLADANDFRKAVNTAFQFLSAIAATVDPRFAIPVLMSAMDRFYYEEKEKYEPFPWIGPGLKTAIAMVANNRRNLGANVRSQAQILKLVKAAAALQLLQQNADLALVFEFKEAEIYKAGVKLSSPADWAIAAEWNTYAKPKGEMQRTVKESTEVVWRNSAEFVDIARDVINGADPAKIPRLQGTLFSYVRVTEFWVGIFLRLVLFVLAQKIKEPINKELYGISLFEEFKFPIYGLQVDQAMVQAAIHDLFWTESWYSKRRGYSLSSMIVERPAIRLDAKTFVTTPLAIADSLNYFVDQSVMGNSGRGGVDVKRDDVFRRAISAPFERSVISMFERGGWTAASVTEDGVWGVGNELLASPEAPCPGEIDVLRDRPMVMFISWVSAKSFLTPLC